MDPAANLRDQEQLSRLILELIEITQVSDLNPEQYANLLDYTQQLAELSQAYCEWIQKGGSPS